MTHWWRAYDEAVDDPKLQQLRPDLFKAWFNLCCITSANLGVLPPPPVLAFKLRTSEVKVNQILTELTDAKLLDHGETGLHPHNWNGRQFKSDVSTDRVKRFRQRHGNGGGSDAGNVAATVPGGVTETAHETPPDTETDSEQSQRQTKKENNPKSLKERKANGLADSGFVWVLRDDPQRWAKYAAAYRAERGKDPPTKPGLGGMGWHFAALPEVVS